MSNTQQCSNCEGSGRICGHGFPYFRCPGPEDNKCLCPFDCTECNTKGYVIPKIRYEITNTDYNSTICNELLRDNWEPFSVIPADYGRPQKIFFKRPCLK